MEENAVFEINDFTIVTDMEHFGAAFEGVLQKYDLFGRRPVLPDDVKYRMTTVDSTTISIGQNKLVVELLQPTPLSSENNPETTPDDIEGEETSIPPFAVVEEISRRSGFERTDDFILKFGIRECIVISPNDSSCTLVDESQTNTVIGTIKTILHSTRCEIPVICYVKDKSLGMLEGYASDGNTSLKFSSIVLRNINRRHCSLSDLLYLFKENLGVSTSAFHDEVFISSRFTHIVPIKKEEYMRIHTLESFGLLASGPVSNLPFEGFEIAATWRSFRENSLTENHNHSDFDISHASYWNVRAQPVTQSLLGVFDEILGIYTEDKRKAIRSDLDCKTILGKNYIQKPVPNAFQKLTGNSASEVQFGKNSYPEKEGTSGPLSPSFVTSWVDFLFGEQSVSESLSHELNLMNAASMSGKYLSEKAILNNEKLTQLFNHTDSKTSESVLANYKCAKKRSTTWKLATALANARVLMHEEPRAEPQLWVEFLIKLRRRYENMERVENAINGIDHLQCKLAQDLQMLQLCIDARRKRHQLLGVAHHNDEFFDASESFNKEVGPKSDVSKTSGEGRLKKIGLMLVGDPTVPMFVPITQDACPLTDEMIDARNEHMFSLSEDERVSLQMELVISDMQSFKAANPNAVFADFLRWHSPKDFDESTGTISERMMIPNNVWMRSWEAAPAVPVANQARIFNDTKIAEEIFDKFESATLDQVREWIKPTVFAATLERLTEIENIFGISEEKMKQRIRTAKLLANATLNNSMSDYKEIAKYCSQVEMIHNMKVHLFQLFENAKAKMHAPLPTEKEIRDAIKELVNLAVWNIWETFDAEKPVFTVKPQEPIGRAIAVICDLDSLTQQQLITGNRKEYIFTWNLKRPSTTTLPMVHRMYADLGLDKHCVYFATSSDSNFFNSSYL